MTNIYFISDGTAIKIGRSKHPKKRKGQLQTSNSNELKLIYILENVESYIEKEIHQTCKLYHIQGEWFDKDVLDFLLGLDFYRENLKQI